MPEMTGRKLGQNERINFDPAFIYHRVYAHENHDVSVTKLWNLLVKTQTHSPNAPRHLILDIDGHRNKNGGFDLDMYDLQTQFIRGHMSKFLTRITTPLGGTVKCTNPQNNDVPKIIEITKAERA